MAYPLYSTSLVVHRLTPLFHGASDFNNTTLRQYASQFRDVLTGEVLRGVRVGLVADDDTLTRVGVLRFVSWRFLEDEENWLAEEGETVQGSHNNTIRSEKGSVGIFVEITYEKVTYSAVLFRDMEKESEAGFAYYPLLLTRMPSTIREVFFDFLGANLDARASIVKLSSLFLTDTLEKYISDVATGGNDPEEAVQLSQTIASIIKDVSITISFDTPGGSSCLKMMDINIPRDDIWPMITRGRKIQQMDRPDANSTKSNRPFTTAVSHYIDGHLALNLNNYDVHISKVSCGAFTIGREGRIKFFPPRDEDDIQRRATKTLVESLVLLSRSRKVFMKYGIAEHPEDE